MLYPSLIQPIISIPSASLRLQYDNLSIGLFGNLQVFQNWRIMVEYDWIWTYQFSIKINLLVDLWYYKQTCWDIETPQHYDSPEWLADMEVRCPWSTLCHYQHHESPWPLASASVTGSEQVSLHFHLIIKSHVIGDPTTCPRTWMLVSWK